ncbi:MAG: aminopeptidase P N-terminal domain-containing protein [Planctomycetota bacterium]
MSLDAAPARDLHRRRRQRLLDALGDGLLLLPTAPEQLRNGDVHHGYRPGSDFHFLTGFPEPEAVLAAWRTGRGTHRAELFVRPRDAEREIWDGRRYGTAGARRVFGVDAAHPVDELWTAVPKLLAQQAAVFWRLGRDPRLDQRLLDAFARLAAARRRRQPAHPTVVDPTAAIARLRLHKDAAELAAMRRAAAATAAGHLAGMRAAAPGMREYEVQAAIEAAFRAAGSPRTGYGSIVASGPNACVLHYHENDRRMARGDLLLVDAGAEVDGVTGDVTRTFPVGGAFSPAQAAVYDAVLKAQLAGIRATRPGAPWNAPHRACVRSLTGALVALGVLRGTVATLVEKDAYKPWYMHGTSHWLGRDVHDVGAYEDARGRPERLRAGMVLTIEPGLYFGARDRRVPAALRGIGVRIEDDVLVTARGTEVLTAAVPKTRAAVQAACAGGGAAG